MMSQLWGGDDGRTIPLGVRSNRNIELFSGVGCRNIGPSAAGLITERRASTPGRRVIDLCSMDVQPCTSHLRRVIWLRR